MDNPFEKQLPENTIFESELNEQNPVVKAEPTKKERKTKRKNQAATLEQVQAIYKLYADQTPVKDIAVKLGLSVQNVNNKLRDTRTELNRRLEEIELTDPKREDYINFLKSIEPRKSIKSSENIVKTAVELHLDQLIPDSIT